MKIKLSTVITNDIQDWNKITKAVNIKKITWIGWYVELTSEIQEIQLSGQIIIWNDSLQSHWQYNSNLSNYIVKDPHLPRTLSCYLQSFV